VTSPEAIVATAVSGFGQLDIVVNNADFKQPVPFGKSTLEGIRAAKAAIFGYTRSLAIDGAADGIKANCVAPGAGTRMTAASDTTDAMKAIIQERMPPALVAPVVAYLAQEECALPGETLVAPAGRVAPMTLGETAGFTDASLTPEIVQARMGEVIDLSWSEVRKQVVLRA
jgi:NAD(P)-dependent dehydrogenase (short-subunit alcohol dehydrogenase family)